jgi:hypothetical protein
MQRTFRIGRALATSVNSFARCVEEQTDGSDDWRRERVTRTTRVARIGVDMSLRASHQLAHRQRRTAQPQIASPAVSWQNNAN